MVLGVVQRFIVLNCSLCERYGVEGKQSIEENQSVRVLELHLHVYDVLCEGRGQGVDGIVHLRRHLACLARLQHRYMEFLQDLGLAAS